MKSQFNYKHLYYFWVVMLLMLSGLDTVTAFSAVIATVNNIGPGLGEVGPSGNYGGLNPSSWVF